METSLGSMRLLALRLVAIVMTFVFAVTACSAGAHLVETEDDVDAAALRSAEAYVGSDLEEWAVTGVSVADASDTPVCDRAFVVMSQQRFDAGVVIEDPILRELLLNADAAMRQLGVSCAASDSAQAETELVDIRRTFGMVEMRLQELGAS